MKFFICAVALYALLEGAVLALFPGLVKDVCARILVLGREKLRSTGISLIIMALLLVFLVNWLL